MPYGLIALLAAIISSAWFVLATGASPGAKIAVAILCLVSLAMGFMFPEWWLPTLLIQAFLVIGIVLYAKAHP